MSEKKLKKLKTIEVKMLDNGCQATLKCGDYGDKISEKIYPDIESVFADVTLYQRRYKLQEVERKAKKASEE